VNALDVVIVMAIVVAAILGYRLGFVARVVSWAGLALGIVVGLALVDDVLEPLSDRPSQTRFVVAVAFLLVLAALGQGAGLAIGMALRRRLGPDAAVDRNDRIGGAVVGGLGVLVLVWLLIPALASTAGWPARAAQGSQIVRVIDEYAPAPPPQAVKLGRRVAEGPFPEVFGPSNGPTDVGPVPQSGLPADVEARVAESVVKIEGPACGQTQSGTGFAIDGDTVVTNAHVVGGERSTVVERADGRRFDADVVAFDPERDLALLRVPGLGIRSLTRSDADVGTIGAVFGHPGAGPLRVAPARIAESLQASGTDIYRTAHTERRIHVLAAQLRPGDSGAPFVDEQGRVVGVAFAIDPGREGVAYALARSELEAFLEDAGSRGAAVATGPCLVG
jgi:S1-C subfamily serine protease